MAVEKFLKMKNGRIVQSEAGDTPQGGGSATTTTAENANAGAITVGQVVYKKSDGDVDLARGNATGTAFPMGVVVSTTVAAGAPATIQVDGIVTATTAVWDALCGTTGGLTPGALYAVSPATAGSYVQVDTHSWASGNWRVPVLKALSSTEALIIDGEPVQYN